MKDYPDHYRLTIEDHDPTWSEWHLDRMPDVHGMPYGKHWWTDRHGRRVEGYETGAVCGGCGWRPDAPGEDDVHSGLAGVRYENVFGRRPDGGKSAPVDPRTSAGSSGAGICRT
jgi:hypothetical protein